MNKLPKVIVLSGYGLNCEEETAFAFELAGGKAEIVHINDLIERKNRLFDYQILAIPGGFSYGDDTGSGKAFANKLKNHLLLQLQKFAQNDKLIIGICNGFQILTQAGLLPGSLTFNDNARYTVRWVDLHIPPLTKGGRGGVSPWLASIEKISLPIAHGEGKFFADKKTLTLMKKQNQIAAIYTKGKICRLQNLNPNPNGSLADVAAVTANKGRILGMMPHPERAIFFTQLPHWTLIKERLIRAGKKLPKFGPGLQIFKNSVNYFK
jgi:phosphoribosylformylglycinamidine synthase